MDLGKLKSLKFLLAVLAALGGVLLSQGVILEGSLAAEIVGWVLNFLGAGTAGAAVVKAPVTEPPQA